MSSSHVFSAPGKALLAGGYLVTEVGNKAFSVALSSRIYASAEQSDTCVLESPQFDEVWQVSPNSEVDHPFFRFIVHLMKLFYNDKFVAARVRIFSDKGFHTQPTTPHKYLDTNELFTYYAKPIADVPKTGLGSSAALCVAIVASMVSLHQDINLDNKNDLRMIHNLAQTAHSLSQGRVGSGFDVATAVYGSLVYSRFSPKYVGFHELSAKELQENISKTWDVVCEPNSLPSSLAIVMGDVGEGAESPVMVREFVAWRKNHLEEAVPLWIALKDAVERFIGILTSLKAGTSFVDASPPLREAMGAIRQQLQAFTKHSGVQIEPSSQTRRIDAAMAVDGVSCGVVPGAGGYDALCLLVDSSRTKEVLEQLKNVDDLKAVQWLDLHETGGIKRHITLC